MIIFTHNNLVKTTRLAFWKFALRLQLPIIFYCPSVCRLLLLLLFLNQLVYKNVLPEPKVPFVKPRVQNPKTLHLLIKDKEKQRFLTFKMMNQHMFEQSPH